MGDIFFSGQNQCHITKVKKSYFCHTFHLRPKKVFWWVGGGQKVTLVSVCVHFLKLLDTLTQKWTQSLTIEIISDVSFYFKYFFLEIEKPEKFPLKHQNKFQQHRINLSSSPLSSDQRQFQKLRMFCWISERILLN